MIGLPGEREEDLLEIIRLSRDLADRFSSKDKRQLSVSINAFVPKPWTPFQWSAMATEKEIKKKRSYLLEGLRRIPGVNVSRKSAREELLQGVFSLGDHELGEALAASIQSGADWSDLYGLNADWLHREKRFEEILPWQFVDCGQDVNRLWRGSHD
jgi:radical SAM superfamily enzyme YgiQ (UPF0313 family)